MNTPKTPPGVDPSAIPILMEPVAGGEPAAPELPADARRDVSPRAPGRTEQQLLFDDIEPQPARPARRPPPSPAERLQAAREMLRARAPAIVDEVMAAHRKQLDDALRERLRRELASLLDDLAPPPDDPR